MTGIFYAVYTEKQYSESNSKIKFILNSEYKPIFFYITPLVYNNEFLSNNSFNDYIFEYPLSINKYKNEKINFNFSLQNVSNMFECMNDIFISGTVPSHNYSNSFILNTRNLNYYNIEVSYDYQDNNYRTLCDNVYTTQYENYDNYILTLLNIEMEHIVKKLSINICEMKRSNENVFDKITSNINISENSHKKITCLIYFGLNSDNSINLNSLVVREILPNYSINNRLSNNTSKTLKIYNSDILITGINEDITNKLSNDNNSYINIEETNSKKIMFTKTFNLFENNLFEKNIYDTIHIKVQFPKSVLINLLENKFITIENLYESEIDNYTNASQNDNF